MNGKESQPNGKVFTILPAAGTGERTGLGTPKQFCDIAGYPLILHTLWKFQRPWIEGTVLAVSGDRLSYLQDLVHQYSLQNVHLVIGGATRHRSIQICVRWIEERVKTCGVDENEVVVIVHDAVRPFVAEETLSSLVQAAQEHGAAGVVCPLVSTILATRPDGTLDYSLVRSKHCSSHTPQAFTYKTITTAYNKISEHDLDHGTEVLHLALENAGVRAKLLPTEDEVWKITYRKDICAAQQFARERLARVAVVAEEADEHVPSLLEECLRNNRLTVLQTSSAVSSLQSNTNAVVIIKNNPSCDQCISDLEAGRERMKQTSVPVKGSLTLLVTMATEPGHTLTELMTRIRNLGAEERFRDIFVYCVVLNAKDVSLESCADRYQKACKLTAELVLKQDELMAGQTFIL